MNKDIDARRVYASNVSSILAYACLHNEHASYAFVAIDVVKAVYYGSL